MSTAAQSSKARRYEVDSRDSYVKIRTRSTVHNIEGRGSGLTGNLEANFVDGRLVRDQPVHMHVEIPVAKLSSGKLVQDEQMHSLIGSKAFPNIVAELISASSTDVANQYKISGSVNVRGTTKLITGEISIVEADGRVEVKGSRDFDIRMWRIEPPKFLGFAVEPNVFLELRVVLRAPGSA